MERISRKGNERNEDTWEGVCYRRIYILLSLSEDFRDYVVGTRDNTAHEEARKIRGTRRGKKAHVLRLVNQINHHSERLSKETLASLKLDLEKAVSIGEY